MHHLLLTFSCEHAKNAGKTTGRAACSDALGRNCLRHAKALRTKRKHRRERMLEVEFSPIDLRDVSQHGGGVASIFVDELGAVAKQLMLVNTL
jgi:hypothetical protein